MKKNDIITEAPRQFGKETEFFFQCVPQNTVSCQANVHNAIELLYVISGSYSVILDNSEYEIFPGDLILFCSNTPHHAVSGTAEKNSYYVIKLPPSFLMELSGKEKMAEYVMRFAINRPENKSIWRKDELSGSRMLDILNSLISEFQSRKYAYDAAIKLDIAALLLEIMRECPPKTQLKHPQVAELIYAAMVYAREHYSQDINEQELAKSLGVSYSYFSRSFKQITGLSFKQYLNRTRIACAEQLLVTTKKSVTEVATDCGYNNVSYFISVYRSVKGKTPYSTKKSNKKESGAD
ncbi:MAG: helix-turn-helix domain-containing protein [Clostridia bacterium]|nr:helix-turn-helix domain-containing protein [Clostridia bacterium]